MTYDDSIEKEVRRKSARSDTLQNTPLPLHQTSGIPEFEIPKATESLQNYFWNFKIHETSADAAKDKEFWNAWNFSMQPFRNITLDLSTFCDQNSMSPKEHWVL